jgi:hypothetical protein
MSKPQYPTIHNNNSIPTQFISLDKNKFKNVSCIVFGLQMFSCFMTKAYAEYLEVVKVYDLKEGTMHYLTHGQSELKWCQDVKFTETALL